MGNGDVRVNIQIIGMGHALPARVLDNRQLEQMVDTTNDWIVERTGIKERRVSDPGMATSDLCYEAATMALNRAGLQPEQIDLIIVATSSPDMLFPSTACLVQEKLGAWNASAFDLEAGCTGFIYAANVAEKYLLSNSCSNVLVIGADMCSRFVDYTDRNTCIIFGDGAGAAVLARGGPDYGFYACMTGADGRGSRHLFMPAGGSALPPSSDTVQNRQHFINMNGSEVFKFATSIVENVCKSLLGQADLNVDDIDVFVPHQANLRIIKSAAKRCRIPMEKTVVHLDRYGNMSAASIPVALSEAEASGFLKAGDVVLMVAFGAGLTYGGVLMRWGRDEKVVL